MDWTEIKAEVPSALSEEAAAIANMTVPYGIYIEDYSNLEQDALDIAHIDLIDEELIKKDRTKAIIHIYIPKEEDAIGAVLFLKDRMTSAGIDFKIMSETVDDTDWNENWKKYFKALEIGKKLVICPSWEKYENKDNRTVLNLDPGAAFGTGTHATTSLCLEILEDSVNENTELLDIGTGSGILAVCALLLGAKSAVGVDIDELSVATANKNAKQNGVFDKAQFFVGDLAENVSGEYDIVCANIVADVVIRLFDDVKKYMKENGILIVSGIIDIRESDLEKSAAEHGFTMIKKLVRKEWRAYVYKK